MAPGGLRLDGHEPPSPELEDVERTYWTATRKRLAALVPGIGA
jgi:hypothetical protein